MRTFPLFLSLCLLFAAASLSAQSARWEPSGGTLSFDQDVELKLVFDDCTPKNESVQPPAIAGLELTLAGAPTQSFTIINYQSSSAFTLSFIAHPTQRGRLRLPAFSVPTDKGDIRVPATTFDVDNGSGASDGNGTAAAAPAGPDTARGRLTPPGGAFWAGEVFPLSYTLDVVNRDRPGAGGFEWAPAPLAVEDWGKPEQFELAVDGEPHIGVTYKTRGYAKNPGKITLNPVRQQVQFMIAGQPLNPFGMSFSQPVISTVTSNAPTLTIKPLPPAPENFSGAVGQFTFTAKAVPATVAVGEPITWTLALAGTGNWPDISGLPAREVSQDFHVVPSQPKRVLQPGSLFDATLSEDAVLIPSKAGRYTLPPVRFVYFDPKDSAYKTLVTEPFTVTVTPAAVATTGPVETNYSVPPANGAAKSAPPAPPAAIPLDPLPGSAIAPVPWSAHTFAAALAAPFAGLLLCWLCLALNRARATDPRRALREAHARLAATLGQIRAVCASAQPAAANAPPAAGPQSAAVPRHAQLRPLLLAWQHDAAVLAQLRHAAPPAAALTDPAWQQLWRESERALYSTDTALPADWPARAETALAARPAPKFSGFTLLLPRNLLPFAAALLLVAVLRAEIPTAADAGQAYRAGDFPTAEKIWRATAAQAPTDWIARHNLGLALAQQDRWPEAAAQWTAAFAQHPENRAVRWHLGLGYDRAGFAVNEFTAFAAPTALEKLARLASPAEWQWIFTGASTLAALAFALLLFRAYGHLRAWAVWTGLGACGLALLVATAALASLRAYGPAADARCAIACRATTLRSIPTEAGEQKTTPLAAGNLAIVDKIFLDWSRLVFDNGQTGWVPTEDLTGLYR